jgi:hypothetical protein
MTKRKTSEDYILEIYLKFGKSDGYEKLVYFGANSDIEVVCPVHGPYWQNAFNHLKSGKCPYCYGFRKTTETFIAEAKEVHGDTYLYPNTVFVSQYKKVEIECRIHGTFTQLPNNHLAGKGCRECGIEVRAAKQRKLYQTFIDQSNLKHNFRYTYPDHNIYVNASTKLDIICSLHGTFKKRPADHLNGEGCPTCAKSKISKVEEEWLASLNIPNLIKQKRIKLSDGTYAVVDGFDPSTNTIYEYHGKFWHGHPDRCDPDEKHPKNKILGSDLYFDTLIREIRLRDLGYKIVSKWA